MIALSVLFAWAYNHTHQSVLITIVLHFMTNFSGTLLNGVGGAFTFTANFWVTR